MKKILLWVAAAVVLVVVGVVVALGLFLDGIVKKGIETAGPQVAKVDVRLAGVSLSPLSGHGKLRGLVVGNPPGFKTPAALQVGELEIRLDPASVLKEKVVVRSIQIHAPEVTIEGGIKDNNLTKIRGNIETAAAQEAGQTQRSGKKLQVDEFILAGGKVNLHLTGIAGVQTSVPLPDIRLSALGTGPEGITTSELSKRVSQVLFDKALAAALPVLGNTVSDALKAAGGDASGTVEKAAKGLTDLFKKKK
jgi:hypothetical protein